MSRGAVEIPGKSVEFLQRELLEMQWLNRLTGWFVESVGLDTAGGPGAAVQFFLYDSIKIFLLLICLIFVISYIQSYFPPERAKRILGRFRGPAANCAAALLGTVTPFCACSSIPLFMGFTAAGLPLSVTFSFLISSPMVDLGSLLLLAGVFGWKVAAVYVATGLLIAVAGGSLIGKLRLEDQVEEFIRLAEAPQLPEQTLTGADRLNYAWDQVRRTARKVAPYVLAGVALGAVIHNWIPETWIVGLLGAGNPFGVVLATAAGVPMYADIFGAVPVAEALLARGARLGVVLSFMMAVTTLSLPSLILLRRAVKPKLLAVFTAVCVAGILAVGYLFNGIQGLLM